RFFSVIFEAALSTSRRPSRVSSISTAPMFPSKRFDFVVPGIGTRPMETPLTPLEFARRARKVYPEQIAVIDGELRWTYAQFFDRCDRWSPFLQRLGSGERDLVAYLAPNTHA